eukprot:TRINITY_DN9416_c0_g1_i1.p1 TRINITY_DN9416_c0_g1~~TRINITY_DN9416_c0_g1_i1.p1  ORF type:complete len:315 (+),score=66.90 TRINITY_DN9416_c0_g1_i1:68-1012(+)
MQMLRRAHRFSGSLRDGFAADSTPVHHNITPWSQMSQRIYSLAGAKSRLIGIVTETSRISCWRSDTFTRPSLRGGWAAESNNHHGACRNAHPPQSFNRPVIRGLLFRPAQLVLSPRTRGYSPMHEANAVWPHILRAIAAALTMAAGGFFFAFYSSLFCGGRTPEQTATPGGSLTDAMRVDTTVSPIAPPATKEVVRVNFNCVTMKGSGLEFVPMQPYIDVVVGEPTLAFFLGVNRSQDTIIGLSTYNVVPEELAQYFAKIQCFCFEEQRFRPKEVIEMPVFFYLDASARDDPIYKKTNELLVSYHFFPLTNENL